jgi:pimeloyl-ACP methyl ester carboxylesterase
VLLEPVEQRGPQLARAQPDLEAVPERARRTAGRRPRRCNPPRSHGWLIVPFPSGAAPNIHARASTAFPHADWVELDGIGHCPQLDVPLEAAQLIQGFTAQR